MGNKVVLCPIQTINEASVFINASCVYKNKDFNYKNKAFVYSLC